jgi:hypothetical protein
MYIMMGRWLTQAEFDGRVMKAAFFQPYSNDAGVWGYFCCVGIMDKISFESLFGVDFSQAVVNRW